MNATLSINGPLDVLVSIAAQLRDQFPEGIETVVEQPAVDGWTVTTMTQLVRRLGKNQRDLLDVVSASPQAFVAADLLQARFANDAGQFIGLTPPISRHRDALIREGILGDDALLPLAAERDPEDRTSNRIVGIRMNPALAPVVRAALEATS